VTRVVICSPDKDLAQCVRGDRVVRFDRMRKAVLDEPGVHERYGFAPASIPDFLALVGDDADGIPGVPRWGEKSASTVLAAYGHLEAIPDDPTEWKVKIRGADALAKSLASHRAEANLYRSLATLRTDVPLKETVDDLEWRGASRERLTAFLARIDDERAIERVLRWI
jgi:5'-3' exonuclease